MRTTSRGIYVILKTKERKIQTINAHIRNILIVKEIQYQFY